MEHESLHHELGMLAEQFAQVHWTSVTGEHVVVAGCHRQAATTGGHPIAESRELFLDLDLLSE
jgi:hypothetical protein